MKELQRIKYQLIDMAEREAMNLYRLAWRAKDHGCKPETVKLIREEARWLQNNATAYPERLISDSFKYDFKYAFRLGGI